MAHSEYKHHEWNSACVEREQLIRTLQEEYRNSGRNLDEEELERMDFLDSSILTDRYYPLTILTDSETAALYACLQVPMKPMSRHLVMKEVVYDIIMNLWDYVNPIEQQAYNILDGNERQNYVRMKVNEFLKWYSSACFAIKIDDYDKIVRPIVAELICVRFEKVPRPLIICRCLSRRLLDSAAVGHGAI